MGGLIILGFFYYRIATDLTSAVMTKTLKHLFYLADLDKALGKVFNACRMSVANAMANLPVEHL